MTSKRETIAARATWLDALARAAVVFALGLASSCGETPDEDVSATTAAVTSGGGGGTSGDPYLVSSCADLQAMENDLYGHYQLTTDIDCAGFDAGDGKGFRPIGSFDWETRFFGTLDGDGHTISNLHIDRPALINVGLFGVTTWATVTDLGLVDVDVTGNKKAAGLVGFADESIFARVFVSGTVVGDWSSGGLAGYLFYCTLDDSYSSATVTGGYESGLFVGIAEASTTQHTYTSGANTSGGSLTYIGYELANSTTGAFFDCDVAGSCGASYASSTSNLQSQSVLNAAGFDFATTWSFGGGYACLQWEDGCGAPSIASQPADQSVLAGQTATFGVTAIGPSLTYQWQRDGTDISGATSASFSFVTTASDDGTTYRCVVTNPAGSVTSDAATLTVSPAPPSITTQPVAQAVDEGEPATFSVVASGVALAYQWQRDGVDVSGATGATYTLDPTALGDDGATFRVVVSNGAGSVTSVPATLSVALAAPTITSAPSGQTVDEGTTIAFAVVAEGSSLSYQWRRDGVDVPGATSDTYELTAAYADDGVDFDVVVTNAAGTTTSDPATLTVNLVAPTVVSSPSPQTVADGAAVSFEVVASGSELTYQWRRDGSSVPGATSPTYVFSATLADDGAAFDVVVSNAAGSATSAAASLTVTPEAPAIVTAPADVTVDDGSLAAFEVVATGSALTYQWQRDGADIPGATSSSYEFVADRADDGSSYRVVVTNAAGSVTSAAAMLSVILLPPVITSGPSPETVTEGDAVTFTVAATGSELTYQWERDGVEIAGATAVTYSLGAAALVDDGASFRVVVSNPAGTVTSTAASLTVELAAPTVTSDPSNVSIVEGGSATFTVVAAGSSLGYQWQRDGSDIPGATGSSYTTPATTLSDDGTTYRVVVSNTAGSATSAAATLSVGLAPPVILASPTDVTVTEGQLATFAVNASGSELSYQWQRDGSDIAGATDETYTLSAAFADDASTFRAVVSNAAGNVTSASATLHVDLAPPAIATHPESQTVVEGEPVTFATTVTGSLVTYQWERDGVAIPGETSDSLTLPTTTVSDDGATFRVVATNAAGSATSSPAVLTVALAPPVLTTEPTPLTVTEGDPATFVVAASGSLLSYQWQRDGVDVPGATASSYAFTSAYADDGSSYRCIVSNAAGSVTSTNAGLVVNLAPPAITAQPMSQTVPEGALASFDVTVAGSEVSYQWRRDGADVPGATGASYGFTASLADDGAVFDVVVSNAAGQVTSSVATLTVDATAPVITTQPVDATTLEGTSVSFTVAATGNSLEYQWRRDGFDIPGANGATYALTPTFADDGTVLTVVVTNPGGSVTSAPAVLGVELAPPAITTQPSAVTVTEGDAILLSAAASGSVLSYQWRKDGADVVGANEATLSIPSAAPADAGSYELVVSNAAGTATSDPAVVSVDLVAPTIVVEPADRTVDEGGTATFAVSASGSALSYQWRRDGVTVPGATSATYELASTYADDGAVFSVVVSNAGGSVTSRDATLSVTLALPAIEAPPAPVTVDEGELATFTVTATGSALSYQWQRDGVDVVGATSPTYALTPTYADDGAGFRVVVSNAAGSVTSSVATLGVDLVAPVIDTQPGDQTVLEGATATFSVVAVGSELSYQWRRDGVDIAGANGASHTLTAAYADDAAVFTVVVSNAAGSVTSAPAGLAVQLGTPTIGTPPASQTVTEGDLVSFSVVATGSELTYQWRRDGVDIAGATTATHELTASLSDDGAAFTVAVANAAGTVTSAPAVLRVDLAPPAITVAPETQTVTEGDSVTFSVSAEGSLLSYQWERNGAPIPGATSPTHTFSSALADDGTSYRVVVSNAAGTVTSASAILTVELAAPTITTPPEDQTVTEGDTATFMVATTGSALSYQWQREGVDIPGATGATYAFAATAADDGAAFRVVVGNAAGSVTSAPATLTVLLEPPLITTQPASQTVTEGDDATFTVAASGSDLTYQWRRADTDIPGANGPSYTFTTTAADDDAVFAVAVTNAAGSVTSAPATLTVDLAAPVITIGPESTGVTEGDSVTFDVTATGTDLSYQWRRDGVDVPGATGASYTFVTTAADDGAVITVIVTNAGGAATSPPATLDVALALPAITVQPSDQAVPDGETASFTVTATGTALAYQWRRDGADVPGATAATYALSATPADDGAVFTVVVSNTAGAVTSAPATLTVDAAAPSITAQPASLTVTEGDTATFNVAAAGTDLSYQWRRDGADVAGATAASYAFAAVYADDGAVFTVVVSNSAGSVTSTGATLVVDPAAPTITTQPVAQSVTEGDAVTFAVVATGSALAYQWQRDGIDIAGANEDTLALASAAVDDAGTYRVVVTNSAGAVTSNPATLTVAHAAPVLTSQPADVTVTEGNVASFSVAATGTDLAYQWRRGGVDIAGATSPTYELTSAAIDDGAIFSVVVTNPGGSVTSASAALTVQLASPTIDTQPVDQSSPEGASATFSVSATGTDLAYQWRRDGAPIAGATTASYTLDPVSASDDGAIFAVVVSNAGGSVTSAPATLSVTLTPPAITTHPSSQTVDDGQPAYFSVVANGSALSYEWRRDGVAIPGAIEETYVLSAAGLSDDGAVFTVVVSNAGGSVTSSAATLSVLPVAPVLTSQPMAQTVAEGGGVTFGVSATGTDPLSYQWYVDAAEIPGATATTYTLDPAPFEDDGAVFTVVVSNAGGSVTSDPATLTVQLAPPAITSHPSSLTVGEGEPVTLEVEASGSALSYQWRKDGAAIAASAATLEITEASYADAGSYSVEVSNAAGSVTSSSAVLTVEVAPPTIETEPADVSVAEGTPATYSVVASGNLLGYQWQRDGADIVGATEASYTLASPTLADDGSTFQVEITNPGGTRSSRIAGLEVTPAPPTIVAQPMPQIVDEGAVATFTLSAVGTGLSYQWFKDDLAIAGETGPSLTIGSATPEDGGVYYCDVTNAAGTVSSAQATLTVRLDPPSITTHPVSQTVAPGDTVTLTVAASGAGLSYQWQRFGADVAGATSPTYSFLADYGDDESSFVALVRNTGGEVASDPAVIDVLDDDAPTLEVLGPSSRTTEEGFAHLTGSASDDGVGLEGVTITSDRFAAQTFAASLDSAGAFEIDVPLEVGENELTVVARDTAGNETSAVVNVTMELPLVPRILITEPMLGLRTDAEQVSVVGRVYSRQDADDIRLTLGARYTFPTGTGGVYDFRFDNVPLALGDNVLTVNGETVHGNVSAQTIVRREDEVGDGGGPAPVIAVSAASADVYLTTDLIPVSGTVTAARCVETVTVNDLPAATTGEGTEVSFDATLTFSGAGADLVEVVIEATDCDGENSELRYMVRRDTIGPVVNVTGLAEAPTENAVLRTPYPVAGSVSDAHLAGFAVDGMSVSLLPTAEEGLFTYEADVALTRGSSRTLTLEAWDLAGNRTLRSVVLRLDADLDMEIQSPREGDELLASGATTDVDVRARVPGLGATDVVVATVDGGPEVALSRAGSSVSGTVPNVAVGGTRTLVVTARDDGGSTLATAAATFDVLDESTIPLELVRMEPESGATGIEANQYVSLLFNKPVDPALLEVQVRETVHGQIYSTPQDGADLRSVSLVELVDVDRDREPVPGRSMTLPGGRLVAFYPSRDYGYGGRVFVDVLYDGEDVGHERFDVRPLPTLVYGFVADHDLTPLSGIEVTVPSLGLSTTSNADGNFDFGYGWEATRTIPPGRHRMVINPGGRHHDYGTVERWLTVHAGRNNYAGTVRLPWLDPSEPTSVARGGETVVLSNGALSLDLGAASLRFVDGSTEGVMRAQLMDRERIDYSYRPSTAPLFGYSMHPAAIRSDGSIGVRLELPFLRGSREYVDALGERVVLLGLDPTSLMLVPIGVAAVDPEDHTVVSERSVELERLDYVAIAVVDDQDLLRRFGAGELDLLELTASLEDGR